MINDLVDTTFVEFEYWPGDWDNYEDISVPMDDLSDFDFESFDKEYEELEDDRTRSD
jgi:hypothetical protein